MIEIKRLWKHACLAQDKVTFFGGQISSLIPKGVSIPLFKKKIGDHVLKKGMFCLSTFRGKWDELIDWLKETGKKGATGVRRNEYYEYGKLCIN